MSNKRQIGGRKYTHIRRGRQSIPTLPTAVTFAGILKGVNFVGLDTAAHGGQQPLSYAADYFIDTKKMNIVRLVVNWEYLQPDLNAGLDATAVSEISTQITRITGKGAYVLFDLHNYMRRKIVVDGTDYIIGDTDGIVPTSKLIAVWKLIVAQWGSNALVMWGIMNEPHDLPDALMITNLQGCIDTIRYDMKNGNPISVCGNGFGNSYAWTHGNNMTVMLTLTDPINNLYIEIHHYFDNFSSGQDASVVRAAWRTELASITTWAQTNGKKLILGEFAAGDNAASITALGQLMTDIAAASDVWKAWTYFSGGGWWPYKRPDNNFYRIDPYGSRWDVNNIFATAAVTWAEPRVDTIQMNALRPYLPSDGLPPNLLLKSRDLSVSPWTHNAATISLNQSDGIYGDVRAHALVEDATAGSVEHNSHQAIDVTGKVTIAASAYSITYSGLFKKGARDLIEIAIFKSDFTGSFIGRFNLAGGYGYGFTGGSGATFIGTTMVAMGGGWYWCSVTGSFPSSVTSLIADFISEAAEGTRAYVGTNGTKATYFDCLQLEDGVTVHAPKINF